MNAASLFIVGLLAAAPAEARPAVSPTFSETDVAWFESRVRPILVARCYECHSGQAGKQKGGLRLDRRSAIVTGGESGPAAEPGDAQSLLLEAIGYAAGGMQMPPAGKLPAAEIALLQEWVRRGLPFAADAQSAEQAGTEKKPGIDFAAGRKHWAFQPVREQPLPPEAGDSWSRGRVDGFVLAKLREKKLSPSPEADRRTLLRRAKFDLLGLPPTMEEVAAFENDRSPDAHERLIDRYLASPHYGERWGRYWLDMARYCDIGESWREGEGKPWVYRDWVIQAFNDDLPYDKFVRMQFAADLLPGAKPADNAALGFLGLSPDYWKELKLDHLVIKQIVADEWEERLDAIGQTFLGLTIGCARCHDHKYDPLAQQDYYALAGVLSSIQMIDRPLIAEAPAKTARAARAKVKELQAKLADLKKSKEPPQDLAEQTAALERQIAELRKTPYFDDPVACGIADAAVHVLPDGEHRTKIEYKPGQAMNVAMHIRGNPGNAGREVPRRFLTVLTHDSTATFQRGSGRADLADALVGDAGPLTARVMVNRVWAHHFGRGLVATPSNFGTRGALPSHPELLDDLTARFMAHGWSLKWLHRELMLSATYRQSGAGDARKQAVDPENIRLWRMAPRRLDVEAWRDATLLVADDLDEKLGGPPTPLTDARNRRRTVYGLVKRRDLDDLLRLNDFPDPVFHNAAREPTTTPLQQLFALNHPLLVERSTAVVARLDRSATTASEARIEKLYEWLLCRKPAGDEAALGRDFVADAERRGTPQAEAWRRYAHALLASNEFQFIE